MTTAHGTSPHARTPFFTALRYEILNRWDDLTDLQRRQVKIGGTALLAVIIAIGSLIFMFPSTDGNAMGSTTVVSGGVDNDYVRKQNEFNAANVKLIESLQAQVKLLQQQVELTGKASKVDPKALKDLQDQIDKINKMLADKDAKVSEIQTKVDGLSNQLVAFAAKLNPIGSAQAATNPPLPGFPVVATQSATVDYTRYNQLASDCQAGGWTPTPSNKEMDAITLNKDTPEQFQKRRENCFGTQRKLQAQAKADFDRQQAARRQQTQQVVQPEPQAQVDDDEQRPYQTAHYRAAGPDNYAQVREYLRNYKGPLWNPQGPQRNRYMNRPAPANAVPCRPPGYNHTVLCAPRGR